VGRASGKKKQRRIKKTALERKLEELGLQDKLRPLRDAEKLEAISGLSRAKGQK